MVSLILPCFKSGKLVLSSVKQIEESLAICGWDYEIIVVDDGGRDIPPELESASAKLRIIRLTRNSGKGAAVRAGMHASRGDVRIFTDIDLPYGTRQIPAMVRYIRESGFHVVIGDRTLPGSTYTDELGAGRKAASALFSTVVGRLVTGGFFDTQCGLKAFRGDVADALFNIVNIDRFAFDVELVYICLKHRLDIKRIPVQLINNETSTVRLFHDGLCGLADISRIKAHQLRGDYASADLDRIVMTDFLRVAKD